MPTGPYARRSHGSASDGRHTTGDLTGSVQRLPVESGRGDVSADPGAGTPSWVKVMVGVILVLVVLAGLLLLTGGHGPGVHVPG